MAITLNYNWQTIKGWTVWRGNGQIEFYIDAKLNKQDTNNNYSVVDTRLRSVKIKALAGSGYSFSLTGANTISGSSVWTFETEDILYGQFTVWHNQDGTATYWISASIYNRYWGIDESQGESVVLPSIPRASRIDSFVGGDIEGKFYATYTSYIPQWENRLKISFTNDRTLALYGNYISGTQVDLTEYAISYITEQMNISGVSSIVLKGEILSYNGDTYIGKSQAINLICSFSNAEPEFTYTFKEINSDVIEVMGDSGNSLINNVSVVEIEVNPTVKKGAEVKSVTVEHSGKIEEKKENFVFQIPVISGDFVITLTDSRNVSVSQKITKELIEYIPVKINKFDFRRVNPTSSNIVFNLESSFTNKKFNQTNNEAVVQFKLDDGDFIDIPKTEYYIDTEENTLSISNYLIQNILDYRVQGIFSVKIEDLFSVSENKMKVIKGIPVFDYGEHDLQINGDLYIADENRENAVKISKYDLTTYQTEEIRIGTWFDGKPIYRKMYYIDSVGPQGTKSFDLGMKLDILVNMYGYFKRDSDNNIFPVNASRVNGVSVIGTTITYFSNTQTHGLFFDVGSDRSTLHGYIVIEYTKA